MSKREAEHGQRKLFKVALGQTISLQVSGLPLKSPVKISLCPFEMARVNNYVRGMCQLPFAYAC